MVNWMNYKNYRVHGFRDTRWIIHDRVGLSKKMIGLRARDLDVLRYNHEKEIEHANRTLCKLKKESKMKRVEALNAKTGNLNMIVTTFCDHPKLLMAYVNSAPDVRKKLVRTVSDWRRISALLVIIQNMEQLLFNLRKLLDKHRYEKKKKMMQYKAIVLKVSQCEDRVVLSATGALSKDEKRVQEISNTMQATKIRSIAAVTITFTYKNILKILNKDALYYQVVLDTLDSNCKELSQMILDALDMGQTVTEYLEDLQREVYDLELNMKINMVIRQKSLAYFYEKVKYFSTRLKSLARTEADILLPVDLNPPKSKSETQIISDIEFIEKSLRRLQYNVFVPSLESILPSYKNQMYQYIRLRKFVDVIDDYKHKLLRILDHARLTQIMLEHSYNDEKKKYLEKKLKLLKYINKEYHKDVKLNNFYKENSDLFQGIRNGMKNIAMTLKRVARPNYPLPADSEVTLIIDVTGEQHMELRPRKLTGNPNIPFTQRLPQEEAEVLMKSNLKKMKILINEVPDYQPNSLLRKALLFRYYETLETLHREQIEEDIDLCAGMIFEEKGVLSYKSAKQESAIYVADNTVDELAVVAEQLRLMTKVRNPWILAEMKAIKKKRKARMKFDERHGPLFEH